VLGWYTQAQALALLSSNTLPPSITSYINSLPAASQYAAQAYILGEATYQRNSPVLTAMASAGGVTSAQLDQLFIAAAQL
jgi:hypothetical protein